MIITLAKHVKGLLPDRILELDVSPSEYQRITDYPIVRVKDVTYQRSGVDRSVYFDISVLDISEYADMADRK